MISGAGVVRQAVALTRPIGSSMPWRRQNSDDQAPPASSTDWRANGALLGDDSADPSALASRARARRSPDESSRRACARRSRAPAPPSKVRRARRSAYAGRRPIYRHCRACARRPRPATAPSNEPAARARSRPISPRRRVPPGSWSGTARRCGESRHRRRRRSACPPTAAAPRAPAEFRRARGPAGGTSPNCGSTARRRHAPSRPARPNALLAPDDRPPRRR